MTEVFGDHGTHLTCSVMRMMSYMAVVLTIMTMAQTQNTIRKMTIAAIFDEGGDRKHELVFRQVISRMRYLLSH